MSVSLSEIPPEDWSPAAREVWERWGITETVVFTLPLTVQFRSVQSRSGLLVRGAQGWGECAPFLEYGPAEASLWLRSAVVFAAGGTGPSPAPWPQRRRLVPVNVTVPVTDPESAYQRVIDAACATAKVKVSDPRVTMEEDVQRVRAVAAALSRVAGAAARLRIDVNGAWTVEQALAAIPRFQEACAEVGGLEYVEQPCATVEELAQVRAAGVAPIAADESIRRATDPFRVVEMDAADIAVIKVAPLGGVDRALQLAQSLPLPVVVSSAIDSSIGLSAGLALAAALPDLPFACGLDTGRLLGRDVCQETLVSSGGFMDADQARSVSDGPLSAERSPVSQDCRTHWLQRVEAMIPYLEDETAS